MNKFIVYLCGGLGNQIFCYLFARKLSKTLDLKVALDGTHYETKPLKKTMGGGQNPLKEISNYFIFVRLFPFYTD